MTNVKEVASNSQQFLRALMTYSWDFLGGPVVNASPFNAGGMGLISGGGGKILRDL